MICSTIYSPTNLLLSQRPRTRMTASMTAAHKTQHFGIPYLSSSIKVTAIPCALGARTANNPAFEWTQCSLVLASVACRAHFADSTAVETRRLGGAVGRSSAPLLRLGGEVGHEKVMVTDMPSLPIQQRTSG